MACSHGSQSWLVALPQGTISLASRSDLLYWPGRAGICPRVALKATTLDDIPLLGRNTVSRVRPRSATHPFPELVTTSGLVRSAAEQLWNAGVVAGRTVAVAMPAGEELLSVAAARWVSRTTSRSAVRVWPSFRSAGLLP